MYDAFESEWMYDAFMKWMDDAFKSEWMYDAFMKWMGDAFMFFFFFFLSLYCCCGCVDMKCHVPMRPIFTAQWSELSVLYPGIQFALFIQGSTASWLVKIPPDYYQLIEHWLPMMCLPIGSLSFRHLTVLHLCQCVCLCVCSLPVFFSLGPHYLRWQKFGCSSHVFCETGESGLSSHIRLRFYSGLFT